MINRELDDGKATTPRNPFYPGGTLPAGHPTYVVRTCDAALAAALQSKSLITVEGGFSTGKSSLVLKVRAELAAINRVCYIDLQDSRKDDEHVFMRFFFDELTEQLHRNVENWRHLDEGARHPLLLIIDELGCLTSRIAPSFIPQLVQFATNRIDRVRVIVCLPVHKPNESIQKFFNSLGITHDKYSSVWHPVRVPLLDNSGISQLVGLLPPRARGFAHAHIDVIASLSGGSPKAVQCLCSELCRAEATNAADPDLRAILNDEESYK